MKREMTFLLAAPERRLLVWIAHRLPARLSPNHLTALGVAGAAMAGAAWALSGLSPAWLWMASLGMALNWFGDSLDGTLARVRRIERPRYGYYIDHLVDAFNTALIGAGIGLSPFVSFEVAMLLVIVYLTLSINVYLESSVFGVFRMAYGRLGPTEIRIILILLNTVLVIGAHGREHFAGLALAVTNPALALVAAGMMATLLVRFAENLARLARDEPARLSAAVRTRAPE